jgi:hypothetical protein
MGNNGAEIQEFDYCSAREATIQVRWWDNEDNKWVIMRGIVEETGEVPPDYKKAYDLLMDYWNNIPDEDKEELGKKLEELGL